jgi:choline dehydrogenase-like flavoprotein
MIFDLLHDRPGTDDVGGVCIVGAGAAGITLAVELARQGKRVLVVEGGGREIEEPAQEPYRSEVVGLMHRGIHSGRFRAHGGTTTKWGGQILELNPEDFEQREWIAESGWPFAKTELAPFYQRALALEGVSAALQKDAEVWRALGLDEPKFPEMQSYLSRWCPEPNFARLHAGTLERHPGIRIWLHANAVELLMEQETVRGLRCRTQTGMEALFQAEHFIFCMGTIECVRFFLQPREGGLPWNRSGLLGRHFQDHIDANAALVQPRSRRAFSALFDNIFLHGYKYHPKVRLSPAEQKSHGLLNCGATMYFQSGIDETLDGLKGTVKHLLRGRFGEVGFDDAGRMVKNAPLLARQTLRYALQHRAYNPASATIKLRVHCEQRPDSASSITLAGEKDSLGLWRTRLDWQISELELSTIRHFAQTAGHSLAEAAEVTPDASLMTGDDTFLAQCDDSNHHMGGMRMAADASAGVVSPELLLYGTRNCFVCSGAVFPTSGFSNPTHTVLALAVRLADHLART